MKPTVNFQNWEKIDLRVGKIVNVEEIENADKLYKLTVDLGGEIGERTLCAGIKNHYKKDELHGKKIVVFVNLEPRKLKGVESQGMLLAATDEKGNLSLISPEEDIELGSRIS